jgi:hypothetical protein
MLFVGPVNSFEEKMAKEIKLVVFDMTFPDGMLDDTYPNEPGSEVYATIENEIQKVISDGCDSQGLDCVNVSKDTHMKSAYPNIIYEVTKS